MNLRVSICRGKAICEVIKKLLREIRGYCKYRITDLFVISPQYSGVSFFTLEKGT
jgi:hypothetical protein